MTKINTTISLLLWTTFLFGQPEIKFDTTVFDFGKVFEKDGRISCDFEFTNTGTEDLNIMQVHCSCGCMAPNWTKTPIPPNGKGKITITMITKGRPGLFHKSSSVFSNATKQPIVLYIKGEVVQSIHTQKSEIILKDTIGDFVFDALVTEMDTVEQRNVNLVKYFKYIGSDSVRINNARTSDPHIFTNYPHNQILQKDSVYSFALTFPFRGRAGLFNKTGTFEFSNGQMVVLRFKAFVKPEYTNYPLEKKLELITKLPPCVLTLPETHKNVHTGFLMTCEQIKNIIDIDTIGKLFNCNKVFFYDLQTDIHPYDRNRAYYVFTAIMFQPFRIIKPDFTLNFTPYKTEKPYNVKVDVIKKPHNVKISFNNKTIGIELSTNIIEQWESECDKTTNFQQAIILAYLNQPMIFSNHNDLEIDIQEVCPTAYKISGTDILFSFSKVQFASSLFPWNDNYPDFSGFNIDDAVFQIPYENNWIIAEGENIKMNNHFITGTIKFQIGRKQSAKTYIIINTDKDEIIEIPIEKLKELFLSYKGFDIEFENYSMYSFNVKFTKLNK